MVTAVCFPIVWGVQAACSCTARRDVAVHRERLREEMHEVLGLNQDGLHWDYSGMGVGAEMVVMVAAWLMEPHECPTLASPWRAWLHAATSMYLVCGKQFRGDRDLSPYNKSALMSDEVWRPYNFSEGLMLNVGHTWCLSLRSSKYLGAVCRTMWNW